MQQLNYSTEFELEIQKDSVIHGLCAWFDVNFTASNLSTSKSVNNISMTTSPLCTPTHWKQTIFQIPEDEKISVQKGDVMRVEMTMKKSHANMREVTVQLSANLCRQGVPFQGFHGTYQVR